ncbi:acyl-CoA dehydratase activase [Collinsella tanakaei]|uniref:acyl-CoA dehydratase activase n=1 Tax=Collinsella tanakaei TaxID=626935 RepID=UPI001F3E5CE9|nr:acyl-CoA dehydratase activase [Collinsella tanakaei]MCF2620946.1 CoA activase [Collinsella tanakaei]
MGSRYGIGVDIGSTATKVTVLDDDGALVHSELMPTGYSSVDAADRVARALAAAGYDVESDAVRIVATGYGRIAVPYADKVVTEITCHGIGAARLFGPQGTVVDVGGQDTKVIQLKGGRVVKFTMNDKCAAGTGRFLEIMADRLGVSQEEMARLAREGAETKISSMCTVFAESEVISLVGRGVPRADIARGVIDSVVARVAALAGQSPAGPFFLTGGLCDNAFVVERLADALGAPVTTCPEARYAGALGAADRALAR